MALKFACDSFFAFLLEAEENNVQRLRRTISRNSKHGSHDQRSSKSIVVEPDALMTNSEADECQIDIAIDEPIRKKRKQKYRNTSHLASSDAFTQYNLDDFQNHFGITRSQVEVLSRELHPHYQFERGSKLPLQNVILTSLWVLCSQESYRMISDRFETCKSVICTSLHKFCTLVSENLEYKICWPRGSAITDTVEGFKDAGFPGTLGAMQACQITIPKPKDVEDADAYMNMKNKFSTTLLAVCDHECKFTYVNVGHPGTLDEGVVFVRSELYEAFQNNPQALLPLEFHMLADIYPYHIIGDISFPLSEYVVTPFVDNDDLTDKEKLYNTKHLSARITISKAFALLKSRFTRLKLLLMQHLAQCSVAVKCCCILHNMSINGKSLTIEIDEEELLPPGVEFIEGYVPTVQAQSKRSAIAEFLSVEYNIVDNSAQF